jgi:glyoxylase-like metal-dependent hydrolase (beta-lactamase superfamily II)
MDINLLLKGTHVMEESEGGVNIVDHTGSVTLIRNGKDNILVDVGGRGRLPDIQKGLVDAKLKVEDIGLIILTHFHLDHAFNIASFPNARVIGWNHEWKSGSTFRFKDIETWRVADGIHILPTPGHTPEHISVVVEMDDGQKVVIAGDAINKKYADSKTISAYAFDKNLYAQSADKVLGVGHKIYIGHGETIELKP